MNLYRLDYEHPSGTYAVRDFYGPVLIPNAQRAKQRAIDAAGAGELPVLITRISGAGSMRPMHRAYPDGTVRRV